MRVIMAGGGTGGHLYPGLAVAREFQRRDRMTDILFIGTEQGIESRVLPREGFSLETIPVKGLKGRGVQGVAQAVTGIPASVWRALGIFNRFRPDLVVGLGGYASGPVLLAAKVRRFRCAIMEQNLRPGFTNRVLARLVDRIFTSYEESTHYFPHAKVVVAGNPVRWQVLPEVEKKGKFTLLVFGGSAGASRINTSAVEALQQMRDLASELRVIHQTGEADLEAVRKAYSVLPFEAAVVPFIDKMDEAYARADLVICRAGASTVAELTAFGKCAIVVPYPYAVYDHQRWNAEALRERGAAEMMLDQELSGAKLARAIRSLYQDPSRLEAMGHAAMKLGRPEAAKRIVDGCYALLEGRAREKAGGGGR